MPSSTVDVMLPEVSRVLQSYLGTFASSNTLGGGDATIESTEVVDRGWSVADSLNDRYLRVTSGNNDNVIRRINDVTISSVTASIILTGSNLASESGVVNFEVHRIDPHRLVDLLNDARQAIFPALYKEVEDDSLHTSAGQKDWPVPSSIERGYVTEVRIRRRQSANAIGNNLLVSLNYDMEAATGTDDWTGANGAAIAEENENQSPDNYVVFAGQKSLKVTYTTSGTNGTVLMTVPDGTDFIGQELNISLWVYTSLADSIKALIDVDGAATVGTAHQGSGWQKLLASAIIPIGASAVKVGISIETGTSVIAWMDEVVAVAGPMEAPRGFETPIMDWREVAGKIQIYREQIPSDHQLIVKGQGMLSAITIVGTTLMEIGAAERPMLYYKAAELVSDGRVLMTQQDEQNSVLRAATHYRNRQADLVTGMPPMVMKRGITP